MKPLSLLAVTTIVIVIRMGIVNGGRVLEASFDCQARLLALEFAVQRLQWAEEDTSTHVRHVREALRLDDECKTFLLPRRARPSLARQTTVDEEVEHEREPRTKIFVDPQRGSDDANNGTLRHPLRTLAAARDVARRRKEHEPDASFTMVLRKGRYFLNETLVLDARDNGLTIEAHEAETVIVSGGVRLPNLILRPTQDDTKIYSLELFALIECVRRTSRVRARSLAYLRTVRTAYDMMLRYYVKEKEDRSFPTQTLRLTYFV